MQKKKKKIFREWSTQNAPHARTLRIFTIFFFHLSFISRHEKKIDTQLNGACSMIKEADQVWTNQICQKWDWNQSFLWTCSNHIIAHDKKEYCAKGVKVSCSETYQYLIVFTNVYCILGLNEMHFNQIYPFFFLIKEKLKLEHDKFPLLISTTLKGSQLPKMKK